ncbi:MAG: MmcB family DNA repair protein [Bauldia sp.]
MLLREPLIVRDGRQSERAESIQRGVGRLLRAGGYSMVTELPLASGRRADIVALGGGGEIWIVEIKSSVEDFRADHKWEEYRPFCDRFSFATLADVPAEIFPEDAGFILADAYGAEEVRPPPAHPLTGARRKAMLLRYAHAAAARLHGLIDPLAVAGL